VTGRPRSEVEALVVFVLAAAYLLLFRPFERPVVLDPATWDYMSLALDDGVIPYRDIFLHKTPGALFCGAAGAAIAHALGVEPIYGVHAVFLLFGALVPALLFYGCRRAGHTVVTAGSAAAWLLAFDQWSLAAIEGARPKVATTAFGLLALSASRTRPVLSGAFGALSSLCWQPGLVFLAAALLHRLRQSTTEAGRSAAVFNAIAPVAAGATLPVAALLGFLAWHGALADFWRDTVIFNLHYVSINARSPLETIARVWALVSKWNALELSVLVPSLLGASLLDRRFPGGLAVATLLYAALVFVSVQAWPDTILLGPGVAATLAIGLSAVGRRYLGALGAAAVLVTALVAMATPRSSRFFPPVTFSEQRESYRALASDLAPSDAVFVVSAPEFLIHTERHNALPWPYMWFGVDRFAAGSSEDGFDAVLRKLEAADPQLMIVCRRWGGPLRKSFEAWAATRYTREAVALYPHVARPMAVYRRAP
jgi:hypothetical protein